MDVVMSPPNYEALFATLDPFLPQSSTPSPPTVPSHIINIHTHKNKI